MPCAVARGHRAGPRRQELTVLGPPSVFGDPNATSAFHRWLESPLVKAPLPIPILLAIAPVIWLFFRSTWRELDAEAQRYRGEWVAKGKWDPRPAVAFAILAVVLTVQEYYGGRYFYDTTIRPFLAAHQTGWIGAVFKLSKYDELFGYAWWAFARCFGYVIVPLPIWKLLFPRDSLLDMGLRMRGLLRHTWIYLVCLAVVVPSMLLVARQPDFGTYYPFYKLCSRSWLDLALWEAMYFAQFFALEMFFRGWLLGALRKNLGSAAIFAMVVPYCMIHYGKPYLEANGAIVAGIVLGSLSMRTKSIYSGFLVHITVALSMDLLSLWHRHALPHVWIAP
ncbi:MAG: CPBP family intramembrane metalloprotease [Deltaproteobacteria bacterium]|nr:CPBP family intramembrane metalloprotease [Deltaproteobacteria bacterium]